MDHLKRLGLRAWIIYGPRGNISGKDETILVFSGSIVAIYVMNCLGDMWETAVLLRDLIVLDSFCMKGQGIAVKFAFMKIVFCTVAFFILFSFILYIYISYELRGFILLFCASFATFEHLYNSSDEYPIDSFVDFEVARVFFGACQPILLPLGGRCLEGPAKSWNAVKLWICPRVFAIGARQVLWHDIAQ